MESAQSWYVMKGAMSVQVVWISESHALQLQENGWVLGIVPLTVNVRRVNTQTSGNPRAVSRSNSTLSTSFIGETIQFHAGLT
jgi:hypothetical protein